METKPITAAKTESAPSFASTARVEGGGSEAGAGNLFGKGDVGVVPGSGTAGGGGGTAASGLGSRFGRAGITRADSDAQNQPRSQTDPNRARDLPADGAAHGHGSRRNAENR